MNRSNLIVAGLVALMIVAASADAVFSQQRGPARGRGRGGGPDAQFAADRADFLTLVAHRDKIRRSVKNLENGVETLTESDDPRIAALIQKHVASMYERLEERRPIRGRDPLFAEIFRRADAITLAAEKTPQGLRVRETSDDPYAVKLIQQHAQVVSLFLKNGVDELHKSHAPPAQ